MNNILSIVWIFFMILNSTKGDDQTDILRNLNSYRQMAAKAQNISNMWKLSWDEGLAKIAYQWTGIEVDELNNSGNWRLFMLYGRHDYAYDDEATWNDKFFGNPPQIVNIHNDGDVAFNVKEHYREKFMPTQTKVGCFAHEWRYFIGGNLYSFEFLCAIGPNGYKRMRGIAIQTNGEPGSNCINGHNNGDGLCVPGLETTVGPPTAKPTPTSDQEFTTKDPEEEEWDLILYLNSAGGKRTLLVVFFVIFVNDHLQQQQSMPNQNARGNNETYCGILGVSGYKSKKLKNCDILDAFSTDFGIILSHQKSILRKLNLVFHYPNDKEKRDVFKVFDCFKGLTTNYKEYSLKVEELHLECKGEHEVLEVLPNLDPDYVKILKIDVGCKKANLKLQEIIYLEQWTRAKEVELIGCFGDYCHFEHFEKVGVSIQIITTEDILAMKEMLFQNPQMQKVSFKFQHYYTDQDLTQRFGETPREFGQWGEEVPWKTWFLRDPDGGGVVKMEYRVNLINLVKINNGQVPTDANIVD
ncbi:hypothetical protein CAEBREN_26230 [Caenorhabditis brenneri]|uniref:DUF38 domain-containing protein n=1 Tax=Caenorhabditis brenneri TaxID=135651 RepID=G0N1H9_CAEBE|nr:hypothetical protein CAEBREN_26230 [Caenorhabditis brenneri]